MIMPQEIKPDDVIGGGTEVGGATPLQTHLAAILAELRMLTTKVKEDARDKKVGSEWRFVAMVVDRLCFCVFFVFFCVATVVVFRQQLF